MTQRDDEDEDAAAPSPAEGGKDDAPEPEQDDAPEPEQDASDDAAPGDASADAEDPWPIAEAEAWQMPDGEAIKLEASRREHAYVRPGALVRNIVWLQLALVAVGTVPWVALLHYGVELSLLEAAWFVAAVVGVGLGVQGQAQHLRWQTAFGWLTAAVPLAFQIRGADLLLGTSLGTFDGLLAAFVASAIALGIMALREIDAVG